MKVSTGQVVRSLAFCSLVAATAAHAEYKLIGFGDINYASQTMTNKDSAGNSTKKIADSFRIGEFDLLFTGPLGDRGSFLVEDVVQFSTQDNSAGMDLERVYYRYTVNDMLKISLGRVHTALGYWNEAYHHGTWFQTSINRPVILNFEDGRGVLPTHLVGLELRGKFGGLNYIANVANGRGYTPDPPTSNHADKNTKALNLMLFYEPSMVRGLRVGAAAFQDTLPASSNLPNSGGSGTLTVTKGKEVITNAHIVYMNNGVDFIAEYHSMKHTFDDSMNTNLTSYYAQFGYLLGEVYTPYVRYEAINFDPNNSDEYLNDENDGRYIGGDKRKVATVGVRYDLNESTAIKAEYANDVTKNSIASTTSTTNAFRSTVAFHF